MGNYFGYESYAAYLAAKAAQNKTISAMLARGDSVSSVAELFNMSQQRVRKIASLPAKKRAKA